MEMGSSSFGVQGASGPKDSIHGLKFGKKIYFEDVGIGGNGGGNGTTTITSSAAAVAAGRPPATAPTRKGKSAGQERQQQPPRCQVEGCQVDLTDAKAYYCRHKVCGMHSKTPKVIVNGMEQRFCQQCSRFHLLPEFDQGKRSCRRRLAGHNERRRKPPPGPLSSRYGRLSLSFHDRGRYGGHLMDFNYPTPPAAARDVWPTVQTNNHLNPRHCIGMVYAPSTGMVNNQAVQLHGLCSAGGSIFADHEVHNGGHPGVVDSSCALSLLSNQPWGAAAANTSSRAPMISTNNYEAGTPMVQSTVAGSISSNSWNFRGNQTLSCVHKLSSEMGLGLAGSSLRSSNYHEIAHEHKPSNGQFSGELGLALQGSRECASSSNSVHWSL